MLTDRLPHRPGQFQHDFSSFTNQLIPGDGLLFVDVEQFLLEDIVGELGFHLANAIPIQVRLSRFHRPGHHVDVRMVTFIMERRVPPEVLGRDMHGCRDVVAVSAYQCPPCLCVVAAETLRVFSMQRDDVRPDVSGVVFQFRHGGVQIHMICVAKQAMVTQPLCTRPGCDVLHVSIRLLHLLPVFLQRQGDERRGVGLCWMCCVVLVLQQSFTSGKSFVSFAMSCSCLRVGGRSSGMISTRSRVAMYLM